MGILDKLKGLIGGSADKAEDAIDKAAEMARDKPPEEHDDGVDMAAEMAEGGLDDAEEE